MKLFMYNLLYSGKNTKMATARAFHVVVVLRKQPLYIRSDLFNFYLKYFVYCE